MNMQCCQKKLFKHFCQNKLPRFTLFFRQKSRIRKCFLDACLRPKNPKTLTLLRVAHLYGRGQRVHGWSCSTSAVNAIPVQPCQLSMPSCNRKTSSNAFPTKKSCRHKLKDKIDFQIRLSNAPITIWQRLFQRGSSRFKIWSTTKV